MDHCKTLKDEVEGLIQRGQLQEYVRGANRQPQQQVPPHQGDQTDGRDIKVQVIIGGSKTGYTNWERKNYAQQARSKPFPQQVNLAKQHEKVPRLSDSPVTFIDEEARGLWHPHKDAIVVNLGIIGRKVYQILIENGSSYDIL